MNSPTQFSEPVNEALKDHVFLLEGWKHKDLLSVLHAWSERFNLEFKLELVVPVLQVERLRHKAYATYRKDRNGFGLIHEISFNSKHLARPLSKILTTLLHEMLHEWQALYGKPGKRNYHNKEFCQKAMQYGLDIDERGRTTVQPGAFTELLERYDVDISSCLLGNNMTEPLKKSANSKLRKWSCLCCNIRAAVDLEVRCLKCGASFQRAEASW